MQLLGLIQGVFSPKISLLVLLFSDLEQKENCLFPKPAKSIKNYFSKNYIKIMGPAIFFCSNIFFMFDGLSTKYIKFQIFCSRESG